MKEVCQIEYISVHYKLPVVAEEVNSERMAILFSN